MPRAFRSHAGGLVGHNGGVFVANPNDDENDLLAARARRLNPEKMTPELFAGYYAFAGITERGVAAKLHQHFVTWDDVNDYSGLGVGTESYTLMQDLSVNGLKPKTLRRWKRALRGLTPVDPRSILKLFTLGVTVDDVVAYLIAGASADEIQMLCSNYGMSVAQVVRYRKGPAPAPGRLARDLAAMTAKARNRVLACELVAFHIPPNLAAGWNTHFDTLGVEQCCALIRAGFSAQEVADHPDLASTPRDLLEIQAALADLTPTAYDINLMHA